MATDLDPDILRDVAMKVGNKETRCKMEGYFWMADEKGQRRRFDYAKLTDAQVGQP